MNRTSLKIKSHNRSKIATLHYQIQYCKYPKLCIQRLPDSVFNNNGRVKLPLDLLPSSKSTDMVSDPVNNQNNATAKEQYLENNGSSPSSEPGSCYNSNINDDLEFESTIGSIFSDTPSLGQWKIENGSTSFPSITSKGEKSQDSAESD